MYHFSSWFPSIASHLPKFLRIIENQRGVSGWQSHSLDSNLSLRSLYHSYKTKPARSCIIESHRATIDLQYCYSGGEKILFSQVSHDKKHKKYLQEIDKDIWEADISCMSSLSLMPNCFALFEPNQLHCPQIFDGNNHEIEKIVLKLPVDFLRFTA